MNADVEAAWHSDGDACTGIHCGNPEHGYAIRAEGLDVDAARAAILLKAAFNAIDTLEAAIRAEAGTLDRVTLVKLIEDHVDIGDYSNGGADIEGLADAILARLAKDAEG